MNARTQKIARRILIIGIFAVAFALVEAAGVIYLRQLFGFERDYLPPSPKVLINLGLLVFLAPEPLVLPNQFIYQIELVREAATIVILVCIALLATRNFKGRVGAFITAFSIWDMFYYLFLRFFAQWPRSLLDIDIFFLIPLPWVGPVLLPVVLFTLLLPLGIYLFFQGELKKP